VAIIGVVAGVMLTLAAKFMAVPVDETVLKIREALPGANCGACGFAGCDEYAKNLAAGGVECNLCTPGGSGVAAILGGLLGRDAGEVVPMQAVVRCSGTCERTNYIMDYQGPQSCEGNNYFFQGRGSCSHACLGFGDCVAVCQYDAIHIVDGIAVVDPYACTGCGMCAKRCPNHLIELTPKANTVFVGCHSTDAGAFTRKICQMGCIGCKRCEKTCSYGAITITSNLASIDTAKCVSCGDCLAVCPTKCIHATIPPPKTAEAVS
jgi:Na+-translocating ferredoxin:NAD+ oxidoreductase RNF subunit RnfB